MQEKLVREIYVRELVVNSKRAYATHRLERLSVTGVYENANVSRNRNKLQQRRRASKRTEKYESLDALHAYIHTGTRTWKI